jgi:hypothetical protein
MKSSGTRTPAGIQLNPSTIRLKIGATKSRIHHGTLIEKPSMYASDASARCVQICARSRLPSRV